MRNAACVENVALLWREGYMYFENHKPEMAGGRAEGNARASRKLAVRSAGSEALLALSEPSNLLRPHTSLRSIIKGQVINL